jgi:filamin
LFVDIQGPNLEKLPFKKIVQNNMQKVLFTPVFKGQYKLSLKWDNYSLVREPILVEALNYSSFKTIKVYGAGLEKAIYKKDTFFFIDCSKISKFQEYPEVTFTDTLNNIIDFGVKLIQISTHVYKCHYSPQFTGNVILNIKYKSRHVLNSPYSIRITDDIDELLKIHFKPEDIETCVLGNEVQTIIDTKDAGAGELTANCSGAHVPAQCEFADKQDGTYILKIRPKEVGKHILQIKYNGKHITDSPFIMRVTAPPDSNKVRAIGPGLVHGTIGDFKSMFMCDTKGAGAGHLTVKIKGPKCLLFF